MIKNSIYIRLYVELLIVPIDGIVLFLISQNLLNTKK